MAGEGTLMRAGSWQAQGEAMLLKTASDVLLQVAGLQQPLKQHRLATEGPHEGKSNSVDSSSTAAGGQGRAHHLVDSATASLLPPLRQISLDVIAASEFNRSKGLGPERQSIFQDVFEQLAGREELAPLQAGQLYTLPSMQFLENMLSDFDSKTGSSGGSGSGGVHGSGSGVGGPLDLPGDAFDLPDFHNNPQAAAAQQQQQQSLRATPFDQQQQLLHQQHGAAAAQQQQQQQQQLGAAGYGGFVPLGGSAPAGMQVQLGQASLHSSSSLTLHASMRAHSAYAPGQMMQHHLGDHQLLLIQQQQLVQQRREGPSLAAAAAVRQPAVPQPAQPRATPRRQAQAYADFDYEEAEVSLQTSKSGRVRKVASFTGVKRRLDVAGHGGGNTVSESRDSRGSIGGADVSSGEVGSKGSKGSRKAGVSAKARKGRRTVCLNCGCHQTPQWRCGPLGPRTLCNACGVRFKKDLPLNCWPIRDGMVLPPGAMLPTGFIVPPGITIHIQPAENE